MRGTCHTERRRAPRRHDLALRAPLEQEDFLAGPLAETKGGDGLGGLVLVGCEEVVEAGVADGLHEPFSARAVSRVSLYIYIFVQR